MGLGLGLSFHLIIQIEARRNAEVSNFRLFRLVGIYGT
jgi:hypothetical protein